jgi:hypothetical protein
MRPRLISSPAWSSHSASSFTAAVIVSRCVSIGSWCANGFEKLADFWSAPTSVRSASASGRSCEKAGQGLELDGRCGDEGSSIAFSLCLGRLLAKSLQYFMVFVVDQAVARLNSWTSTVLW